MTERLRVSVKDLEIAVDGFDAAGKRVWGADAPIAFKREPGGAPTPSVERGEPARAEPAAAARPLSVASTASPPSS